MWKVRVLFDMVHILYIHLYIKKMKELKIQLKMSLMFHIKLMGKDHRAPYKHIFCPYTHP